MSNVIQLTFPSRSAQRAAKHAALLETFASHRRDQGDVFWLKENAEILNILECTGQSVAPEALAAYDELYAGIEERLEFFPQYYRFFLSIAQDLEALGMPGGKSARMAQWIADQGLVEAELSDLQRGEAIRLLTRNGVILSEDVTRINGRLKQFASRRSTFAIPNKKAAYELTHISFYLSEYGRKNPQLGDAVRRSLDNAGTLAILDCNWDLLAEVSVAMRYGGWVPPRIWDETLARATEGFSVAEGDGAMRQDDYHEYLVCNWALSAAGGEPFKISTRPGPVSFHSAPRYTSALREMSEILHELGPRRSADWHLSRDYLLDAVTSEAADMILHAEEAADDFDEFYAHFARTAMRAPTREVARA
ncbi:DUF6902 family protein [Pseudooceanicola sp. C21-150M6]|uniref:DUF6902 family protein n=1 Tax=Pseudooceanicola sp. C21-150M6 TaxID=3434355 RepID=UPI003D7FE75B